MLYLWWGTKKTNEVMLHYAMLLICSKNALSRTQNKASVDESLKQGLVRCCPDPLHRQRVEGEF